MSRAGFIWRTIETYKPAKVLDIGSGALPRFYNFNGITEVVRLNLLPGVEVEVTGDGEQLPFKDSTIPMVIATELIEHVRHPMRLLKEAHRVLEPGGLLVLSTPNASSLPNRLALLLGAFLPDREIHENGDVGHIHFFDWAFTRRMVSQAGFRILEDRSSGGSRLLPKSMRESIMLLLQKSSNDSTSGSSEMTRTVMI